MNYAGAVAVVCWAMAVYGIASYAAVQLRMIRRRTVFPVTGTLVGRTRVTARLSNLTGDSGEYRGLLWATTADGVACRATRQWVSVIAECRQDGDDVVVDAVFPQGLRLFYLGLIGFMVFLTVMFVSFAGPLGWWLAVPIGLLLAVAGQYVLHVRHARAAGRLLPRYLEAACVDAVAKTRSGHENLMKLS